MSTTTAVDPIVDVDDLDPDALGPNPYPGSDKPEWTEKFSAALAHASGMPREITDLVAPFFSRPKTVLTRRGGDDATPYVLNPEYLSRNAVGQLVLEAPGHGFTGNAGEYNERIRRRYDAAFKPDADPNRVLPTLVTGRGYGGLAPYLTTDAPVDHSRVNALLGHMNQALDRADKDRGYALREDMQVHGQQETTLHVPLVRVIAEPDEDGTSRVRRVVDLTAVKGANRSRARLSLFGLTPENIVFGVRPRTLMGAARQPEPRSTDPRVWVPTFADLLREAYDDPDHPGHHIAVRAAQVAVVPIQLIIGAPNLGEFHNAVFDPNRVDHRRPPLDYELAEKAASDMRAVLRKHKEVGLIDEPTRVWLAGEGPDPVPVDGESVVDARDRRDRALLDVMFPGPAVPGSVDPNRLVRNVLGEPAPSSTGEKHVQHRTRMFSSLVSDGYLERWNPRVLDALISARSIREQRTFRDAGSWRDLLDQAAGGDVDALTTFVITRGMHWLAERDLIEADRGSVGAQAADPAADQDLTEVEQEDRARRIRRTMASIRGSLTTQPARAVGLFEELAHAVNTGAAPREVDEDGSPIDGTVATRTWFDTAFPKRPVRRGGNTPPAPAEPEPAEPEPSPQQVLLHAQQQFDNDITHGLTAAMAQAFATTRDLAAAAGDADDTALPDRLRESVESIERALAAVSDDTKTLLASLPDLKYGMLDVGTLASRCEAFLIEEAP